MASLVLALSHVMDKIYGRLEYNSLTNMMNTDLFRYVVVFEDLGKYTCKVRTRMRLCELNDIQQQGNCNTIFFKMDI